MGTGIELLFTFMKGSSFLMNKRNINTNKYNDYLKQEISKLFSQHKSQCFWFKFNILRLKRFILLTLFIFIFQYITCINLKSLWPAFPMYPPIGISFVMFYLFGFSSFIGLILGGFLGYYINDFSLSTIILYLIADIGGGYIGAKLSQNIFSSDIRIFAHGHEINRFILKNAFFTCLFSATMRLVALMIEQYKIVGTIPYPELIYNLINFWLSDLNGLLVISSLILSWIYVPFSREKISRKPITFYPIVIFILLVIFPIINIHQFFDIYLLIPALIISLFIANLYGSFVITAQMFIFSTLYLSYFIIYKQNYLINLGQPNYSLVIIFLLTYILASFYLCNKNEVN